MCVGPSEASAAATSAAAAELSVAGSARWTSDGLSAFRSVASFLMFAAEVLAPGGGRVDQDDQRLARTEALLGLSRVVGGDDADPERVQPVGERAVAAQRDHRDVGAGLDVGRGEMADRRRLAGAA